MISVPHAFYLIASVCLILATAVLVKVCCIWIKDSEDEKKSRHFRAVVSVRAYDEILVANAILKKICDELGVAYDDIECEHAEHEDEAE